MKTGFQLIIPPTHLNEAYGSKYLSEEAKTEAKQGSLSEEKYQTLGCYPCPFCGERKSHKFYDKNMKTPNMNDMTRALIKGKALNIEEVDVTPKGLVIDEKETAKGGILMLSIRQNLLETIHGGNPDRFVNQYEFLKMVRNPLSLHNPSPKYGEENIVNAWGITRSWPIGTPGPFPVHTADKVVIKDITHWRDYVKAPSLKFAEAEWEPFIQQAEAVDRSQYYVSAFVAPGLFEPGGRKMGFLTFQVYFQERSSFFLRY